MSGVSRRRIITTGTVVAVGLTSIIANSKAQANTQQPVESATIFNLNGKFSEKVVLITGATSGIGATTARAFAAQGAIVHFCGRREKLGKQVAESIVAAGGKATYQRADVREEADIKAFVDDCIQRYGRLDIAFNNAGIDRPFASVK